MTASLAWLAWLLASLIILLSTRNPLLLVVFLTLLVALGIRLSAPPDRKRWLGQNLRFIGTMILLSALINFIFTHTGATRLFALPRDWFLIGGPFTLESLVYGGINGLVISSLYLTFTLLNKALSIQQLTRLIPNAFYPLTLITTIALTFFPSIQERTRQIKEAQMIRGNPMEKLTDWIPILIPLMVTSLENAIRLSESMTARGFQANKDSRKPSAGLAILIVATFLVFAGWILSLFDYPLWVSWVLYLIAAISLALLLSIQSRAVRVTHLHRDRWEKTDGFAASAFTLVFLVMLGLILAQKTAFLSYTPYPALTFPTLPPAAWLLCLVPGLPILLRPNDHRD